MEKKKILMITGIVVAVLLLSLLVVGIVDGIWPWHGAKAYGKLFGATGNTPAATEPAATEPTEETEPVVDEEGGDSASIPHIPVLDGENPDGSSNVKEEVDLGGNTGSETGDNSGASDAPDADATIQGNKIPGWGN